MSKNTSQMRRHCALFDLHVPHNINLSPVISYIKDYQPTDFIIGGDFLNLEWCSHWNEREFSYVGLEKLSMMLKQEMNAGKDVLNQLNKVLPENCNKYFLPGNHERFLYWACMTYPALAGTVTLGVDSMTFKSDLAEISKRAIASLLEKHLDTASFGVKVLPYGKELQLGKITYIHGDSAPSMNAMKKRFPARNVVAGHLHTHEVSTIHNSGDTRAANQYVLAPCLCELAPGYLKDNSTRWLQGFWTADVYPSGHFDGRVVKVIDGSTISNGKVYK
jgi:UDP-2,3-diacylglucosamine pyrophosphatase LpxH